MQNQKQTILIYSAFSGTYYEIPESDIKLLEVGQVPLLKKPSSKCSKCFGRGHLGKDTQSYTYFICNCVQKVINHDIMKHVENITIG
jgi:hypothetical protein